MRGFANFKSNINTQKSHSSFVLKLFHNLFGHDCHLFLEKIINMTTQKAIDSKVEGIIAMSSEKIKSVKTQILKILDFHRFLDATSEKLSYTLTFFLSLDANGMEDGLFKRKKAYPYEKHQSIDSFYEPLKLRKKDYFSTLKQ